MRDDNSGIENEKLSYANRITFIINPLNNNQPKPIPISSAIPTTKAIKKGEENEDDRRQRERQRKKPDS